MANGIEARGRRGRGGGAARRAQAAGEGGPSMSAPVTAKSGKAFSQAKLSRNILLVDKRRSQTVKTPKTQAPQWFKMGLGG